MSRGWAIFTGIFFLVLVPAGAYVGVQVYKLMRVCFGMVGYKLIGFQGNDVKLQFTIAVKNPSNLKVGILGYNIDIDINGQKVANLTSGTYKELLPNQTSNLELLANIDLKKSFGAVGSKEILNYFFTSQFDKIIVNINGKFKGSLLKVPVNIPVTFKYSLREILQIMNSPSTPC